MTKKQRRRAWGSVTEVKRGKKYVLRWTQNTLQGRKRLTKTVHGTYRAACLELDRLHVLVDSMAESAKSPTVGECYRRWYVPMLERKRETGKVKTRSIEVYKRAWDKIASPRWADVRADEVSPTEVQEWLDGLAKANAEIALMLLRGAVDQAMQLDAVADNRFRRRYIMPSNKTRTRSKDVYGLDAAERMLALLRGNALEPAFILACFGSCRTGESMGVYCREVASIESDGVDFALVPITRAAKGKKRELTADGDLKTPESVRDVLVPYPYGARLLEIARERAAAGYDLLISGDDGLPLSTANLYHLWTGTVPEPDRIPFANCRNSWRTFAEYEWGVDFDTLELLMGHRIPGMSGAHYIRPSIQQLAHRFAVSYAKHLRRRDA